jgi:uncharacterized protein (PEP-CTERM system associated)
LPERHAAWPRPVRVGAAVSAISVIVAAVPGPAMAQRYSFESGVSVTGEWSSNPDLAPSGQEDPGLILAFNPWLSFSRTSGRLNATAAGAMGMQIDTRQDGYGLSFRPSGSANASWEAVDNFFFIDARAAIYSTLNNPFLATPDPLSPTNTSTSYQVGIAPYIRGTLFGEFDYLVKSDNSWTDQAWGDGLDYRGQYSATNTVNIERSPRPLGGAFNFQQQLLSSSVEDQGLLKTETARFSLRYQLTNYLAVGARIGAEKYNYTLTANDWQRFYGAEMSWRPNERTILEGYWEDRIFGNSWQFAFNYRRPLMAFNVVSSRLVSNTPQQFATFPGLASLTALLDSAFTTRIPDPAERQRAVSEFLSQTQLPAELLIPTFIYSENFTIQEINRAGVVFSGQRNSLAFTIYQTVTEYSPGVSSAVPLTSKTQDNGTQVALSRQLSPVTAATATASWRNTKNLFDTAQETTQTELRLEASRQFARRATGTVGARYQWISSTVTNDANELAVYFTLGYSFN